MADSSPSLLLPKQIDDLGLALISLARELWVTKDRQIVLESMLQKKGLIDDVAALQPDEALVAKLAEERARFIEGLSAVLMRSATLNSHSHQKERTMQVELGQVGRASLDFLVEFARASGKLEPQIAKEISAAGISEETLADDLDDRLAQMDAALAESEAAHMRGLIREWSSVSHGLIALEAFEEIRPALEPQLKELADGPTTLQTLPHFKSPDYIDGVWFHRTHGGWDGHEHQGFVHSELVHKRYVTAIYKGDIFGIRREVLDHLPRKDYKRVFEMGTSSGYHTVGLADAFPDAEISGCDISRAMLEQAVRVGNERQKRWKLYVGRAEDTRLPDASFDLVSSFILLHELPAPVIKQVFAEAFRLLEPGGTMIMTDVPPYAKQDKMTTWRFDSGARHGGEPYWREAGQIDPEALAKDVGFAKVESFKHPGAGNYWVTIGHKA